MKNIRLISTDKPSRIFYLASNLHLEMGQLITPKDYQNIYITSDKEIKEGYAYYPELDEVLLFDDKQGEVYEKGRQLKVILTTDPDLIKDGVQAIDDEFLEWFVKNPSCEKVQLDSTCKCIECGSSVKSFCDYAYKCNPQIFYKIILPKEEPKQEPEYIETQYEFESRIINEVWDRDEPKQETLEEAADRLVYDSTEENKGFPQIKAFILGAKWQAKRMYSEEEVIELLTARCKHFGTTMTPFRELLLKQDLEWFEQFKKK
jgi:hypothetical protein